MRDIDIIELMLYRANKPCMRLPEQCDCDFHRSMAALETVKRDVLIYRERC